MSTAQWQSQAMPAQLAFLAIYSPSLGLTDDTFAEQLVYYYSRVAYETRANARRSARNDAAGGDAARAAENEKLRHIGLAQGMVDFARGFSEGMPVNSIDTEKSRIVLQELEKDWWILASIDLTRLPVLSPASDTSRKSDSAPAMEYSAREISPPALLVQQLIQAHRIFTLHHGPSLSELFIRTPRDKFCATLERYWNRFSRRWDVLMHGNPAIDIFTGIKLSSGGELGMGVGEEEWGSGEREVLEDLVGRTEGLVDILVSRFGEPVPSDEEKSGSEIERLPWMGTCSEPLATDGLVFGGIGSISRKSLRDISLWLRQIYKYGEYAYGVRDAPNRDRRKRRRRGNAAGAASAESPRKPFTRGNSETSNISQTDAAEEVGPKDAPGRLQTRSSTASSKSSLAHLEIPPPIVSAVERSLHEATESANSTQDTTRDEESTEYNGTTLGIPDQYMKYLTFGLSTFAKPSRKRPQGSRHSSTSSFKQTKFPGHVKPPDIVETDEEESILKAMQPIPDGDEVKQKIAVQRRREATGHFMIGLKGDLEDVPDDSSNAAKDGNLSDEFEGTRTVLRTLQIEMSRKKKTNMNDPDDTSSLDSRASPVNIALKNYRRLRVLIYVHRPFVYCFLFENRSPKLTMTRFYKELHRSLVPIHGSLLSSTSVANVSRRLEDANVSATASDKGSVKSSGRSPSKSSKPNPIYDLIYDPALLTIHTSIPNIPEPGTPAAEGIISNGRRGGSATSWTRVEALNAHSQILNTLESTQRNPHEYERTSKTNRGWWVAWMKLPPLIEPDGQGAPASRKSSPKVSKRENNSPSRTGSHDSNATVVPSTHVPTSTKQAPQLNRIAFLLRKASDTSPARSTTNSRSATATTSLWNALSLRPSIMSDAAANSKPVADNVPAEVPGGMGVDARKYIEGLLSLNR